MKTPGLRNLPSLGDVLENPTIKNLVERVNRSAVVHGVRAVYDEVRREAQQSLHEAAVPPLGELAERIVRRVLRGDAAVMRRVINATGELFPHELGGAPLADEAAAAVAEGARSYNSFALDLTTDEPRDPTLAVRATLQKLSGAEAALVVQSFAGATVLAVAACAAGKEAIVAHGELIDIGGGVRLPDLIAAGGSTLRGVGATNTTRVEDFAAALGPQTGALLHVVPTNFSLVGQCEATPLAELVRLAHGAQLPVVDLLDAGTLIDLTAYGVPEQQHVGGHLAAGVDLVLIDGGKLMGGPSCGVILGKRSAVERLERHPLFRAFQVDKLTLTGLAATLALYEDPTGASRVPVVQLLQTSLDNLAHRAARLAAQMQPLSLFASVEPVQTAAPRPTWRLALTPTAESAERLARRLRTGAPAVAARVEEQRILLDLRTVFASEDMQLLAAVEQLAEMEAGEGGGRKVEGA